MPTNQPTMSGRPLAFGSFSCRLTSISIQQVLTQAQRSKPSRPNAGTISRREAKALTSRLTCQPVCQPVFQSNMHMPRIIIRIGYTRDRQVRQANEQASCPADKQPPMHLLNCWCVHAIPCSHLQQWSYAQKQLLNKDDVERPTSRETELGVGLYNSTQLGVLP